jgi:hypothetical protein
MYLVSWESWDEKMGRLHDTDLEKTNSKRWNS